MKSRGVYKQEQQQYHPGTKRRRYQQQDATVLISTSVDSGTLRHLCVQALEGEVGEKARSLSVRAHDHARSDTRSGTTNGPPRRDAHTIYLEKTAHPSCFFQASSSTTAVKVT